MREGESFLNKQYPDLQHSPEIESASRRQEVRTGEKPKEKNEKVEAYLNRLEEIFNVENPKRERRVDILKDKLHELFVIKPNEIPESYFKHQQRIAREQGHGDIEITDQMRAQMAETITHDQAQSLDAWVDYLGSEDAPYPNWLKYFAFRSITKLSEYDKDKKEFKKRSKGTTAPFPDINREALAYVLDSIEKSHKKEAREGATDEQWEKLLKTANFGKLYGYAIEKITPATEEEKENIQGEWIKYDQGSDPEPLYKSLQGHGTYWCIAGESVATNYLKLGDHYIFYTKDKDGRTAVPRSCIRMENGEIAEVRGIADKDQNLEGNMTDIVKEKMKELPGAERYEKKVSDMKRLTEISNKYQPTAELILEIKQIEEGKGNFGYDYAIADKRWRELKDELFYRRLENEDIQLTKEELRFLYEFDGPIDGFGYQKDPRVRELREERDQKVDYARIFDCQPEDVAFKLREIGDNTIAFIGDIDFSETSDYTDNYSDSMPKSLKYIKGNVDFSGSNIIDLGQLEAVLGDARFRYSKVESFGNLKFVRKSVWIEKYSKLNFSGIKIGGRIIREVW